MHLLNQNNESYNTNIHRKKTKKELLLKKKKENY